LKNVFRIDEAQLQQHLGVLVRGANEDTLNKMLDAEADELCSAVCCERTEVHRYLRSGRYHRKLQNKAAEATLKLPKLSQQKSETSIIEC
jgi:putative transposase